MRLFEIIKKYYENKLLLKTNIKSELKFKRKQDIKQLSNEFLNLNINKHFILELTHKVMDKNGKCKYWIIDYFLCNTSLKQVYYGESFKAIKLTGIGAGKRFNLRANSMFSLTYVSLTINNELWEGDLDKPPYIPQHCVTIAELIEYANNENEMRKKKYEEPLLQMDNNEQQFYK